MLASFLFSLNATAPVFLLMVLGWIFRRMGWLNAAFCQVTDKLVFRVTLPILLFTDMAGTHILETFDARYVLFCALVTTVIFFALWGGARLCLRNKAFIGEFVQASYRSSAAILGCALLENMYGTTGMAPLMILGSVPLFNLYAVLVLTLEAPDTRDIPLRAQLRQALCTVAKNPIILGILLGLLTSLLGLGSFPPIVDQTFSNLSVLTTPLALLSIGASLQPPRAGQLRLSLCAAGIKLLLLPALFLPLAVFMGFTDTKLVALIVMLGSTTTPTCYIMAKNMGHEGTLSATVIALTTICSAFSLTLWIFLSRYLGYLG